MKEDHDLKDRMVKYDKWADNGEIPTASKVIPISQSLTNLQWILPTKYWQYLRIQNHLLLQIAVVEL